MRNRLQVWKAQQGCGGCLCDETYAMQAVRHNASARASSQAAAWEAGAGQIIWLLGLLPQSTRHYCASGRAPFANVPDHMAYCPHQHANSSPGGCRGRDADHDQDQHHQRSHCTDASGAHHPLPGAPVLNGGLPQLLIRATLADKRIRGRGGSRHCCSDVRWGFGPQAGWWTYHRASCATEYGALNKGGSVFVRVF